MVTFLTIVHVLICFFLILVVLLQPGRAGGGLGGAFGGASQQVFGGRGAGNFMTKLTWASAAVFIVTSVGLAYLGSSTAGDIPEEVDESAEQVP